MEEIRYKDFTMVELKDILRMLQSERRKTEIKKQSVFRWLDQHIHEVTNTIRDFEKAVKDARPN